MPDQRHILVVEDDRDLREAICEALEQRGFHTGQAAGVAGRVLVLLQGAWLATMILLGMWMWRERRRRGN